MPDDSQGDDVPEEEPSASAKRPKSKRSKRATKKRAGRRSSKAPGSGGASVGDAPEGAAPRGEAKAGEPALLPFEGEADEVPEPRSKRGPATSDAPFDGAVFPSAESLEGQLDYADADDAQPEDGDEEFDDDYDGALDLDAPQLNEAARVEAARQELGLADDEMILVAVRGMILFPGVVLPVVVGRERSVKALQAAAKAGGEVGLLLQKDGEQEDPGPRDLYRIGTVAGIVRYLAAPDDNHHVIVQGRDRFRVKRFTRREPFYVAQIERLPDPGAEEAGTDVEARALLLKHQATTALQLLPEPPEELEQAVKSASTPALLTDLIATFIEQPADEKQEILATLPLVPRMEKVSAKLKHVIEVLSLSKELRKKTRVGMEKAQREYFLREQLKTIQAELADGVAPEIKELEEAIDAAGLPEPVEVEARKELARLERMPEQAAEYGMLRTYLETVTELPWSKSTEDRLDLKKARRILNRDHYGLEKVKRRILEFLAVKQLKPDGKSPILCLVGPPGVGKTSLGRSIAEAMGREFVRASLGGVHDESEIRGHRRTYVGAMPGMIVQGLRRAGANNPVFLLDEMDKLGRGFQGDPSSALLEVLDPAQNSTFRDHYLGQPFDLSRVMFVATANVLHEIPGPLRDRCEVIELVGYTDEEKLEIAKRYLVARQTEENGLTPKQLNIKEDGLSELIQSYTREAGCRELERQIAAVCRYAATQIASGERRRMTVGKRDLEPILGPPKFEDEVRLRTSIPGVATGLAWTAVGGDLLFIEATRMPGKGQLILTGQLGDVMKESVRAALSLVRGRAEGLGIAAEVFEKTDLHVHFPAGAIPKDGPSAGVTVTTALVSLLTGQKVRPDLAMTGEVSLRGLVLPIGGVKEKLLAAYRAGVRTVLIPKRNEKDLGEVPAAALQALEVIGVEHVDEVLEIALAGTRSSALSSSSRKRASKKTSKKKVASKKRAGRTRPRRSS
jgi:ATP-dependent Lon protease